MLNIIEAIGETIEKTLAGKSNQISKKPRSADFWHNYYLAAEAGTPAGKLALLAEHADPIIRKRVAENLHLPAYVQRILADDADADVRLALSLNPSTLIEIWTKLIHDESELVRLSLAKNNQLPVQMLIDLARDKQSSIAARAQQTIEEIFGAARLSAA